MTTFFLFLSPQFLINHSDARKIFIKCSHCTTLRVVALDKAHSHVQHGTSFRSEICALQALFCSKIFGNHLAMIQPRLVALTATMPNSYLPLFSQLLTISLFSGDSLICGSSIDFSQCQIEMRSYITSNKGHYVLKSLSLVSKILQENPSLSAVVFCNSRKQLQHFCDHLEQKLNKMKLNIDVIHINGSLHKIDKFWRICLFCDETHIREANFRVLVTTNAANVGIDMLSIVLQMRFDWPCDLLTYFQEEGRGSRQRGSKLICILYADLPSYVSLILQLVVEVDS
jgi:superfamily II DNA helicase RecQ